jgi:hypothetical protein
MTEKENIATTEQTLEEEYERLSRIEVIYNEQVAKWLKLASFYEKFFFPIYIGFYSLLLVFYYVFQNFISNWFLLLLLIFLISLTCLLIVGRVAKTRISKTKNEIGLKKEELMFLLSYKVKTNLDCLEKEKISKRRDYFKKTAYSTALQLADIMDEWKYGNIQIIVEMIGKKIDTLKTNFRELILPNLFTEDGKILRRTSIFMKYFCTYLLDPSIDKVNSLGTLSSTFPQPKYTSSKQKLNTFFNNKPRLFRAIFSFAVSATIIILLLFLDLTLGIAIAVGATCFWGAFSGFDKLFSIKKEIESK